MEPLHKSPFHARPGPPPETDPLASAVRGTRLGAVAAAAVIAVLLGARSFFGWQPPFDAIWLVGPAFLLPVVAGALRASARRRRTDREPL